MTYEDYPYNNSVGECGHDEDKIYGYVSSYKKFHGYRDLGMMLEESSKQPVAAVMNYSSDMFRYYKSGILRSCCDKELDLDCDDLDLPLDHAVTITGY